MNSTYRAHAEVCARFYDLALDAPAAAAFIFDRARCRPGERTLFVGSMFAIAGALAARGLSLAIVDESEDMVSEGRRRFPTIDVRRADLRDLPAGEPFDLVLVVGRVFTHMIAGDDLASALRSCRRVLATGGRLFFDNYEDTKIRTTNYFNGEISLSASDCRIRRRSSTALLSAAPCVVRWSADYDGVMAGRPFQFSDTMQHRAFSRGEIAALLPGYGFALQDQGDNFDETSFFTLARAV